MPDKKTIHVAIGFVTGRKSFQRVLKTYIYNWLECGLTERENVKLDLYVAYDLKYANTKPSDYTNVSLSLLTLIDGCRFIGVPEIQEEIQRLTKNDVLSSEEAEMLFGSGYAAKRNAVQYFAMKNHADCLIFLDDDEYPVAVSNTHGTARPCGEDSTYSKHIWTISGTRI